MFAWNRSNGCDGKCRSALALLWSDLICFSYPLSAGVFKRSLEIAKEIFVDDWETYFGKGLHKSLRLKSLGLFVFKELALCLKTLLTMQNDREMYRQLLAGWDENLISDFFGKLHANGLFRNDKVTKFRSRFRYSAVSSFYCRKVRKFLSAKLGSNA